MVHQTIPTSHLFVYYLTKECYTSNDTDITPCVLLNKIMLHIKRYRRHQLGHVQSILNPVKQDHIVQSLYLLLFISSLVQELDKDDKLGLRTRQG